MSDSVFLSNLHYFLAQTDGTYKFPNSAEGDLLKRAKVEVEALHSENAALREDRERLNWMDEYDAEVQKYENPEDGSKRYELWFFVDSDPSPVFSAPTLRAAIDAARAKEAKP